MSDNWIILIPEDPRMIPAPKNQEVAINRFREICPNADEVETEVSDEVRFVHCGGNFEKVSCPKCAQELTIDWWQSQMDNDYNGVGFQLNSLTLPCCGAEYTLHDLNYDWAQGFARFSLEAMNPDIGEIEEREVGKFEAILGCKLRVIYQHI